MANNIHEYSIFNKPHGSWPNAVSRAPTADRVRERADTSRAATVTMVKVSRSSTVMTRVAVLPGVRVVKSSCSKELSDSD